MPGGEIQGSLFHSTVSVANLLAAWKEFRRGKIKKGDVASFEFQLEDNLLQLHEELANRTYQHGQYKAFYVSDPKRRHIHKGSVRDRVVHQTVFRVLYQIFDTHFIHDSCSSRIAKGTHFGVSRLLRACRKVTENWKAPAYTLKCDIRKFFDSIDHVILRKMIEKEVNDEDMLWLIDTIFSSFEKDVRKGLPLGNVTSQLFANIYLNELDQFAKHVLKAKHYFRYSDDFIIVHRDRAYLEEILVKIKSFVCEKLLLDLHPYKVEIRKVSQGVDFLGYVTSPHRTTIRRTTTIRLLKRLLISQKDFREGKIEKHVFESTVHSYLGILAWARNRKLRRWVWKLLELVKER